MDSLVFEVLKISSDSGCGSGDGMGGWSMGHTLTGPRGLTSTLVTTSVWKLEWSGPKVSDGTPR